MRFPPQLTRSCVWRLNSAALFLIGTGALIGAGALGLVGCGASDGPAPGTTGRLERPTLRRVDSSHPKPELLVVQHLEPTESLETWTVKAKVPARAKRLENGRFAVRVDSWGKRRVTIPGEFSSKTFNQVALRGIFPGVFSISLRVTGPDGMQMDSARMATVNTQELQTVLFDLPRMGRTSVVYDTMNFQLAKGSKWFEVHGADVLYRPRSMALPDPEGEGHLIELDHARHGVGVASGVPLTCRIDANSDAILRFAYGLPQTLHVDGQQVRLAVTLTGVASSGGAPGAMRRNWQAEMVSDASVDSIWEEAEIALTDFEGPIDVHIELSVDEGDALCALAEFAVIQRGSTAPSVLLVTSDTHRGDHLGSVDSVLHIETPALDALAKRGVLFEDCYASTNVTSPSHVALMTATHPRDTHLVTNTAHLSDQAQTLAERYREAGYMTIGVVSVRHLGPSGTGLGQGFDRMLAPGSSTWDASVAVDHVRKWLEDADGVPVFVWMHLFDAHHPYGPPERFDRYYYPENKNPFDDELPAIEFGADCIPDDLREVRDVEFPKAQYRAEITYLDHELRRLLEHPRLSQGILAVTADHGEILEKGGTYFNHAALYPDTLHIPLILAWPDGPGGIRVEHGVEQIHLGRTLLDLSGLEHLEFPGESLVSDLDPASEHSELPRFALSANASSASVTLKPWHFVLYLRPYKGRFREERPLHSFELYNLEQDLACLNDLAAGESVETRRIGQLRAMLVDWLTTSSDNNLTMAGQQTDEAMAQLAALGYATGAAVVETKTWIDVECECEHCAQFND
ncbi:MAG: arylsulfatase A-like enzyme [Chlamydiales bacterium]|jgi:arylsulfatase A-like enzyme